MLVGMTSSRVLACALVLCVVVSGCSCDRRSGTPDVAIDASAPLDAPFAAPDVLGSDAPERDAFGLDARSLDAPSADAFGADARSVLVDAAAPSDSGLDVLCTSRIGPSNPFTIPPECADVFDASAYCGAITSGRVVYIDLDTGAVCDGPTLRGGALFANASLGWAGDAMYACNGSRAMKISLRDGSVIDIGTPCVAVTTDDDGELLVLPGYGGDVVHYASEGDAMSGRAGSTDALGHGSSRIGAHEDDVVLAWHSTDRVGVADLSVASPLARELRLSGYDDWIHGLDVLPTGEVLVAGIDRTAGGTGVEVITLYDATTGAVVRSVTPALSSMIEGLTCLSGAPPSPLPVGVFTHETDVPASGACGAIDSYASVMDNRHRPSVMSGTCVMGRPSNYLGYCDLLSASDPAELHVIGVYEGTGGTHGTVHGTVDVTVRARPRPIVLVLSSYEAVDWRLTIEPGATIERVLVSDFPGGIASIVTGLPAGVTPEVIDACDFGFGWEPEHNTGGSDIRRTIAAIRGLTGLAETTFQGCYAGTSFTVPY